MALQLSAGLRAPFWVWMQLPSVRAIIASLRYDSVNGCVQPLRTGPYGTWQVYEPGFEYYNDERATPSNKIWLMPDEHMSNSRRWTVSKKLEGKIALITGGSRGIGAAVAKQTLSI